MSKQIGRWIHFILCIGTLAWLGQTQDLFGRTPKLLTGAQARAIALNKTHGSGVTHAELNRATGKPLWLVDVTIRGSKNAKEVTIDAYSGKVVSVQTLRPSDRAEAAVGGGH